ncbi:MAG: hypothetical protein V4469_00995 [Patescibacteria group bacterium]
MTKTTYLTIVSIIFFIVGVVHIIRIINGAAINIEGFEVPMIASWIGAIVALFLSYQGTQLRNK